MTKNFSNFDSSDSSICDWFGQDGWQAVYKRLQPRMAKASGFGESIRIWRKHLYFDTCQKAKSPIAIASGFVTPYHNKEH